MATKTGGACFFTNNKGNILIEGHNSDFGIITEIHSHRAEIFGLFSALIFLEEYCRYFFIKFESTIQYLCDNLEVVNKVKAIQSEKYLSDKAYKTTDHDAVLVLKDLISRNMTINHAKSHAEKRKKKEHFTLPEVLNSKADNIITEKAKNPINTHILNTPIAVYINNKYNPNNYNSAIKMRSGKTEAKQFMMNKYRWSTKTINNIAWKYHATIINSQSHSTQRMMRKFVHRWLSFGSHNRGEALLCSFYKVLEDETMPRDHFLQCSVSTIHKRSGYNQLRHYLTTFKLQKN